MTPRLPSYARYRVTLPPMQRGRWRIIVDDVKSWRSSPSIHECWGDQGPAFFWPGAHRILQRSEIVKTKIANAEFIAAGGVPYSEDPDETFDFNRVRWKTWMADSAVEIATQMPAIRRLRGNVLIGGLGLGILVRAALMNPLVTAVDVLELDEDVIDMVGPHYSDPRVRILHEDAMAFKPQGRRWYDVVYMDIWECAGACNLLDMLKLRLLWRDRCAWYGAWSEDLAINLMAKGETPELSQDNVRFALGVLGKPQASIQG